MKELIANHLPQWMLTEHFVLPTWQWLALLAALILGLFFKRIARYFLSLFVRMTDNDRFRFQNQVFKTLENPSGLFIAGVFWALCLRIIKIEGTAHLILSYIIQVTVSVSLVWAVYNLADIAVARMKTWADKTENNLDDHLVPLVGKALKVFIVILGSLITIQNLGINVLSLLAGLGLGGLAFALAAKDTCANFFGSIMIFLDRPFMVGDWVVAGDSEGTVEEIGFRSTRIRTFYNSVISVPNANMANMSIDNMGRREFRRVNTTLGVLYSTPPEKIEEFVEGIKQIIQDNSYTRKDYFHVCFKGYNSSSLDIMVYFFLRVPDWGQELAEKQKIFFEILKLAHNIGVDFAFPTQTLHVESLPESTKNLEQLKT